MNSCRVPSESSGSSFEAGRNLAKLLSNAFHRAKPLGIITLTLFEFAVSWRALGQASLLSCCHPNTGSAQNAEHGLDVTWANAIAAHDILDDVIIEHLLKGELPQHR
jgi:hypothetical protein